jgi:iron complex transport system ATP-binding protein
MSYQVLDITFTYPNGSRPVLREVSLCVEPGQVVVLLGPNGAGKTTLLLCMMNLLKPALGQIDIDGQDIRDLSPREVASKVAYVPQSHEPAFDYTVLEFVVMGRAPKYGIFGKPDRGDEIRCLEILEELGISHLASKSCMEISGGERQQALIARALAQEPEMILFDEPTAHLDFGNQERALVQIKKMAERGHGVLMTTHHPDHALMLGDQTALLSKHGHLEQGPTATIVTEERLSSLYDTRLRLIEIEQLGRQACLLPGIGRKEGQL